MDAIEQENSSLKGQKKRLGEGVYSTTTEKVSLIRIVAPYSFIHTDIL